MTHDKGGWYGDSDGHRDAALRADENIVQTYWRQTKEWFASIRGD